MRKIREVLRFTDAQRRRLAHKGKLLGRAALRRLATIATPDTILGWYRKPIARKYDGTEKRGPGRPRTPSDIVALVVQMAKNNPSWGYTRIRGALQNLGHNIGRSTIARILAEHGLEPAPQRPQRWSTFLAAHWGAICAADFFTVEASRCTGWSGTHVFFVIDLASRRVAIGGIVHEPHGEWVENALRGMLDAVDGFLLGKRYLILDHDPVFTRGVRELLASGGVKTVRLPARSPNLDSYAERFVGSIRRECLSKIIPLGERHLRVATGTDMEHYHRERNHQGLGNRLLEPEIAANGDAPIQRHTRLGGLLSFYHREAA